MIEKKYTVAAADADGFAADATGAAFALANTVTPDGMAHLVTVENKTGNDHSDKTILLAGFDADGNAINETITGPAGSATVTSAKYFRVLDSASAAIGEDTVDIGWSAAAVTPFHKMNNLKGGAVAVLTGGTINFDLQHTYKVEADGAAFAKDTNKTANFEASYAHPVAGVRAKVNSHTSGTLTVQIIEGE